MGNKNAFTHRIIEQQLLLNQNAEQKRDNSILLIAMMSNFITFAAHKCASKLGQGLMHSFIRATIFGIDL